MSDPGCRRRHTSAALGNEQALEPLLDPQRYLLRNSSTTGALVAPARNGNPRAIEYLAGIANDPRKQPEWGMVTEGLKKPAADGNAAALDALALVARAQNETIRANAVRALQNAALNQHSKATELLRTLQENK